MLNRWNFLKPGFYEGIKIAEGTKIVIFVDNLDRVKSEKVVEVLEAVNLLLAKRLFIVFLGMDTEVVSGAVQGGNDYLEKIVQLPFRIPTINDGQLREYVSTLVPTPSEGLPTASEGSEPTKVAEPTPTAEPIQRGELEPLEHSVIEREAFERFFGLMSKRNPRQMKRLVNMYRLYKLLAARRGFGVVDEQYQEQLVKWVVAVGEWPQFLDLARFDPDLEGLSDVAAHHIDYATTTGNVFSPDGSTVDVGTDQFRNHYPAFSRIWESAPPITDSDVRQFLSLTP